jgi:formamidopyrimidine-DNA glycosylase
VPELPEVELARQVLAGAGDHCPRCGAEMAHGTVGGRSTWWCSKEQAG